MSNRYNSFDKQIQNAVRRATTKQLIGALRKTGIALALMAYTLAWVKFGWEMTLVLSLLHWSINMEQRIRRGEK